MILYFAGIALTVAAAVTCVRRGQARPWLCVILIFPTVGAAVYLLSEVLLPGSLVPRGPRRPSKRELRHAQAETRRLDNSEAWTNYAQVLRARKEVREALAAAERAVERDEDNLRAHYELGLARLLTRRHAEAAESLERVVQTDPAHDSGEARYALAVAYECGGDEPEARRTLEALARTTSLPKVLYRLAALQARGGATTEARETLQRIIDEAEYVPGYHRREVRPWVRKARRALSGLPPPTSP